jgi:hypothetical protein
MSLCDLSSHIETFLSSKSCHVEHFDLFEEEFPDLPLRGLRNKVHAECAFFIH